MRPIPFSMRERTYASNNIKRLRQAAGLTLDELAARMEPESTASTVAKLENRKMACSVDYILAIAKVLEVPPSEIISEGPVNNVRFIPLVGNVAAGRWQDAVAVSEQSLAIPSHLRGANLFALRPEGDSMDRICSDGGFIVVDPEQRDLLDKKFYVIMNDEGECTFKQFSLNPLQLVPCSTNQEHQPIPLGQSPFSVIGRVIYVGQEL